ncbi:helix-turn-helix transcriptional regulator [Pyxidicoccus parkwayensis]|uniref:Helix-turn-helix transcriptional regulator n=1 Tax=Pyxidicoccus parkwayensis TaxID=2813578 RepID=A0ABX7P266_9BACT|nr:helix-turn-helix transcriptional regulator [Pyxidicoccus parkwaysis]QSQ23078.1 helix-turn-helix transcriptional regulator [Pyxidicoccus parkwaysis]
MDEVAAIELGQKLRSARLRAGLSTTQVADSAALPAEAYARMERGKLLPTLRALDALCQILHIRPAWLQRPSVPAP